MSEPVNQASSAPRSAAQLYEEAQRASAIAAELRTQAIEQARLERVASKPQMPDLSAGPVILGFEKHQSGRNYAYAAIGWTEGRYKRWAVTGTEARRFNWAGFLEFVGEGNWASIRVMNIGPTLLPEGTEPPVAERVGRYGRITAGRVGVDPFAEGSDYI